MPLWRQVSWVRVPPTAIELADATFRGEVDLRVPWECDRACDRSLLRFNDFLTRSILHIRDKSSNRRIVLAQSIVYNRCNKHDGSFRKRGCRWEPMSQSFYNDPPLLSSHS